MYVPSTYKTQSLYVLLPLTTNVAAACQFFLDLVKSFIVFNRHQTRTKMADAEGEKRGGFGRGRGGRGG